MDNNDFQTNPIKRLYSVMLFDTKNRLKIKPKNDEDLNTFVNYLNKDFTNGKKALTYYMHSSCPYAQLIDADTADELISLKIQMVNNFKDKNWLKSLEYIS